MAKKEIDDRFLRFGTVAFTATTKVNDFIDRLESGHVSGTRCTECGEVFFPPRADCCRCLSSDTEWFDVTGTGKLVTWSTLSFAPVGFDADLPYAVAVVDYGEYSVFGRIAKEIPESDLTVGMEMKTRVNRLDDGRLNYVFDRTG
jgi:hypothetical protein